MVGRRARTAAVAAITCLGLVVAACSGGDSDGSSGKTGDDKASEIAEEAAGEESEADSEWEHEVEETAEQRGLEIPEDAFLFRRLMPGGVPDRQAFAAAGRQADALRAKSARAAAAGRVAVHRWKFLGPRRVGGRVVDAVVDPTRRNTLYVATSTNGVWVSHDAGRTFDSVWPSDLTHSMGALAVTPDGTLYAGTGEANPGGGSITYGGDGVYRSTDHGQTWQPVGLRGAGTIGRITIDPAHPRRVWVAVTGNLFVPGGTRGLYVSDNGGRSWERSLAPTNPTTGAADVAVDPDHPRHVLVTMWDHIRRPDARDYTGLGSGIWESRNGGRTWKRLGHRQGLQRPSPDTGRIGVAFAPGDPKRAYAIYANDETGAFENFFVSTDGGRSWDRPAGADDLTDSQSVYGWWFGRVHVDPNDSDRLFVLGLNLWGSTDGGQSFDVVGGDELHADQHIMVWDPKKRDRVYIGNDGGLYRSGADGETGSWFKGTDQPWSQYAGLDVSEQDPGRFIGGLQDNGSIASWTKPPFDSVLGGDGQRPLINPTDKHNYYACYQYGACSGWDNGKQFGLPIESKRFPYFTQLEFDPGDPGTIYAGGDKLNRSTDGGRSFETITKDLGKGEAGDEPNPLYRNHYGTISTLAIAPSDSDVIWVGTDNGYLYRTADGGEHWTELANPVRPKLWISRIAIDPKRPKSVYIAFSGFREGDNGSYLLRTSDAGRHWADIGRRLPKAPVNDVIVERKHLYVGTDVGVFTSGKSRPNWRALGRGLPNLVVTDLRYVPGHHRLFAATFGMGVWSLPAPR